LTPRFGRTFRSPPTLLASCGLTRPYADQHGRSPSGATDAGTLVGIVGDLKQFRKCRCGGWPDVAQRLDGLLAAIEVRDHLWRHAEDRVSRRLGVISQPAISLAVRLTALFFSDADGHCPCHGDDPRSARDPHWRELLLFYEYFHGDTGRSSPSSHLCSNVPACVSQAAGSATSASAAARVGVGKPAQKRAGKLENPTGTVQKFVEQTFPSQGRTGRNANYSPIRPRPRGALGSNPACPPERTFRPGRQIHRRSVRFSVARKDAVPRVEEDHLPSFFGCGRRPRRVIRGCGFRCQEKAIGRIKAPGRLVGWGTVRWPVAGARP
jgi:hypothetical protein